MFLFLLCRPLRDTDSVQVDTSVLLAYDFVAKLWILLLFRKRSGGQLLSVTKDRNTRNPQGEPEKLMSHTHIPHANPGRGPDADHFGS
jgi:hypothetical protein